MNIKFILFFPFISSLNIILNTTLKSRSHYRNLTRLASISEKKLDELLKLVNVIINDDGTMNVGRFLVKPIPRGREMSENRRGSITGEAVSIVPVDSTAGKTRKRRPLTHLPFKDQFFGSKKDPSLAQRRLLLWPR